MNCELIKPNSELTRWSTQLNTPQKEGLAHKPNCDKISCIEMIQIKDWSHTALNMNFIPHFN